MTPMFIHKNNKVGKMIIYKVTNKINGKFYIGQTMRNLKKRIADHIRKNNDGSYFHNALKKYGIDNFEWSIIEECDSKEELDEMEFHYIKQYDTYNNGYNLTLGGEYNPMSYKIYRKKISESLKGHIVTHETREKIIMSLLGRKNPKHSKFMKENNPSKRPEVREKLSKMRSGENHHFFGKKLTEDHIRNIKNGIGERKGKNNSNAKNWFLKSPDGKSYNFCGNLKEKIKEITGYSHFTVWYKYKGKYKGWLLKEV